MVLQQVFVASNMTILNYKPGRKRLKHSFHLGPARTEVCKKTFSDTLAIKDPFIKGVISMRDPETGVVREYKRGKSMINFN